MNLQEVINQMESQGDLERTCKGFGVSDAPAESSLETCIQVVPPVHRTPDTILVQILQIVKSSVKSAEDRLM